MRSFKANASIVEWFLPIWVEEGRPPLQNTIAMVLGDLIGEFVGLPADKAFVCVRVDGLLALLWSLLCLGLGKVLLVVWVRGTTYHRGLHCF